MDNYSEELLTEPSEIDSDPNRFRDLLAQIKDGSQKAAWQLLEDYGPHVYRVVRYHLGPGLRAKFDSADFVQSVWASFFLNCVQIQSFSEPSELIRFLAALARNKVIDKVRRSHDLVRDVRRERSLDGGDLQEHRRLQSCLTASDFAMAREKWNLLFDKQPPRTQKIIYMKFMGDDEHAIATCLDVDVKTVRRVLNKLLLKATA